MRKNHSNQECLIRAAVTDCGSCKPVPSIVAVRWAIAALLLSSGSSAFAAAPLFDSVRLNIGINCRWERKCIGSQTRAMDSALSYVKSRRPAQFLIHLCNRNAKRGPYRVDWIGFNNCIRNPRFKRR